MDRRSVIRAFAAAVAAVGAVLALLSCSNPIDIVGAVQTEVMVANKKFLVISQTGPFSPNDTAVNPGTTLWLKFDRALATGTITPATVVFTPATTWTWIYEPSTYTLTIRPASLESLTPYSVVVGGGLTAADGSVLQNNLTINFTTKQAPSGTMTINAGGAYTTTPAATLNFTYNFATVQIRFSMTEAEIGPGPSDGNQSLWQTKAASFPFNLGTDGTKTIYFQLVDNLGNTTSGYDATAGTHPLSASVTLDQVAPAVISFSIENGATYAATTAVTLYNNVTDATSPIEMHFLNKNGSWSAWVDYSPTTAWSLSSVGTRQVSAEFRDKAGNVSLTILSDAIIAGAPYFYIYMNYHGYGGATVGQIYAWWSVTAPDVGTDTYYLSWRNHPSGGWVQWTNTTATNLLFASATEMILDFAVQIGNSDPSVGPFNTSTAPYSAVRPGFTSDVVVVYNDADPTDTALASTIYGVLKNVGPWFSGSSYYGTFPTWTVTLIPQSFISTTYNSYNRIFGYPVIVTPGVTAWENANWVRNIATNGKGLLAMGEGGARMLDVISGNFSRWFKLGQPPANIGYKNSSPVSAHNYIYSRTLGNTVWSNPIYYSTIYPDKTYYYITSVAVARLAVNRADGTAPPGGWLYAAEPTGNPPVPSDTNFTVVQQDRFLQFGFYGLPNRVYYAYPWFVNLVYRMGEAYYP